LPTTLNNVTARSAKLFHLTEGMLRLVALKRAGYGLASVALKRTGCDVWQLECQASNVTASAQSDYLGLHGYMLSAFFQLISCIVHRAVLKFSPCCNKRLPQFVRIADW